MESLKIGVVINKDYKATSGGGFSYYERLVTGIDQHAFDARLNFSFVVFGERRDIPFDKPLLFVNPADRYSFKNKLLSLLYKKSNLPVLRTFFLEKISKRYKDMYTKHAEQILRDGDIQLLYYLAPSDEKYNYPYVETHWDNGHSSMFAFPEVAMNETFKNREAYLFSLKKAFAVFCESAAGKKELLSFLQVNPNRIFIVPLFPGNVAALHVEPDSEKAILEKNGLRRNNFFFYPAQFWSHKNHYNLVKAFEKIARLRPEIKLVFTGADKGNLEHITTLVKRMHLESSVLFLGFVSNEAVCTFYKNAIALVMPTFLGPTNMPLLEAAELGCPVICSKLEGHYELMEDRAEYILPEEPESIGSALFKMIQTESKREGFKNPVFSFENALSSIESNFLQLLPIRSVFGNNFRQY